MKLKKLYVAILAVVPCALIISGSTPAFAATVNYNDLIDDSVFDNYNSMSATQIDTFLNGFSSSCISSNHGFRAPDPTGYNPTNGFLYGSNTTAGRVIGDAAKAYQINPQVLLTTMQKEQSLVSGGGGCSKLGYVGAMGYGCPDGGTTHNYSGINLYTLNGAEVTSVIGTCVSSNLEVGFSRQVIHAAWLLKFDRERAEGNITWAIINGSWNNSDDLNTPYGGDMTEGTFQRIPSGPATFYDGTAPIDGQSIKMANGATAALYDYTPHKAGNSNFDTIFDNWFGTTNAPHFAATYVSESNYPSLMPGQSTTVDFEFQNTGNMFWKDDLSNFPGYLPVHLAATGPINRSSIFHDSSWAAPSRPAVNFTKVYESDGTTLAADQHTVSPGQIAVFQFTMTAPANAKPGVRREYFQPILEGSKSWSLGGVAYLDVTVEKQTFSASYVTESSYPSLTPGQSTTADFEFQNTGNMFWKDDSSTFPGYRPVHLATTGPINRSSMFASPSWAAVNRPNVTFTKVYESDGTTLAADQHTVSPGQIAVFQFTMTAPANTKPGTYREYFQPILEGSKDWSLGAVAYLDVTVQ